MDFDKTDVNDIFSNQPIEGFASTMSEQPDWIDFVSSIHKKSPESSTKGSEIDSLLRTSSPESSEIDSLLPTPESSEIDTKSDNSDLSDLSDQLGRIEFHPDLVSDFPNGVYSIKDWDPDDLEAYEKVIASFEEDVDDFSGTLPDSIDYGDPLDLRDWDSDVDS